MGSARPIIPLIATDSTQTRLLVKQIGVRCGFRCTVLPSSAGIEVALYAIDPDLVLIDLLAAESAKSIGDIIRRLSGGGVATILLNAPDDWQVLLGDRVVALDLSADVEAIAQQIARWQPHRPLSPAVDQVILREPLTDAERRVLTQLRHGRSNDQIAEQLSLSAHTVKSHLYSVYQKLGVKNRSAAALWASRSLTD